MEPSVMDQIKAVLDEIHLAKSRVKNQLTEREKKLLLEKLTVVLTPYFSVPETDEDAEESRWFGIDKAHDMEIQGDTQDDVVGAWIAELTIDRDKVMSTQVGNAYFYVYPQPSGNEELWVTTKEHREELVAA